MAISGLADNTDLANALAAKLTTPGAWTTYTPTVAGFTVGNATTTARYVQIGKIVHVRITIVYGSTSSMSGSPTVTLPVNAQSAASWPFIVQLYDSGNTFYMGQGWLTNVGIMQIHSFGTSGVLANLGATTPFTWSSGDEIRISGTYEAA